MLLLVLGLAFLLLALGDLEPRLIIVFPLTYGLVDMKPLGLQPAITGDHLLGLPPILNLVLA